MTKVNHASGLLMSTALCVLLNAPLFAADGAMLEEIIVTATKMGGTKLQETPLAITAFSSDQMTKTGIKEVRDLMAMTPNLNVAQNASFAQIYIRGIGSNNVFAGSDPSSTIHLDGVYLARPTAYFFNFLDVERVEVLRGPQGTLYGRNSVGGTINVISRKPDNDLRLKLQGTVGNYDFYRGEALVSGPLIKDKLAASVAFMRSKRDGYLENIVPGVGDIDSEDVWSVRGQLRATPSAELELLLRADYMVDDGQIAGNVKLLEPYGPLEDTVLRDFRKVALGTEGFMERKNRGVSLEINYDLSDAAKITSLTAYRKGTLEAAGDTDATSDLRLITTWLEKQDQLSQELNLSGRWDRLGYVLGLYYFEEEVNPNPTGEGVNNFLAGIIVNPSPLVNTDAWSVYGQARYDLTEKLAITTGLRYTEEDKKFDQDFTISLMAAGNPVIGQVTYETDDTYKAWTPKFGIEFRPIDDVMLYVSATRGFKSGGFNFTSQNADQGFDPEFLWSYEAGMKSDLLDRRLRLNATGFYYDYTNLQVQSFLTPGVIDITNAADAEVTGLEIEMLAHPSDGLAFGANLAHLDATYKNYTEAPITGGTIDASGNRLNSAPKWNYSLFGQYDLSVGDIGNAFVRGEYSWRSRQYFTVVNDDIQTQGSYELVNANVYRIWTQPDERRIHRVQWEFHGSSRRTCG